MVRMRVLMTVANDTSLDLGRLSMASTWRRMAVMMAMTFDPSFGGCIGSGCPVRRAGAGEHRQAGESAEFRDTAVHCRDSEFLLLPFCTSETGSGLVAASLLSESPASTPRLTRWTRGSPDSLTPSTSSCA